MSGRPELVGVVTCMLHLPTKTVCTAVTGTTCSVLFHNSVRTDARRITTADKTVHHHYRYSHLS